MSHANEESEDASRDWKYEPLMPIEHLLPPYRRDSPLARHFAKLDAELEKEKALEKKPSTAATEK